MATDATGAPTPLGIPKYNTSADAPSGLGFNAAMDVMDTLIAARVNKPAGVVSGDVPVWNGTTFVRPTGTPDATKFLRGDSTWAAPSGAMAQILDFTATGALANLDTNTLLGGSIPQTYNHLRIVTYIRETGAVGGDFGSMQFNGDTAANYIHQQMLSSNATQTDNQNLARTNIFGVATQGGSTQANQFGITTIEIPNYRNTVGFKAATLTSAEFSSLVATDNYMAMFGGGWRSTAAITRLVITAGTGNIDIGSRISIYGIL